MEERRLLSATQLTTLPYETAGSNPSPMYLVNGTTLFFADDATGSQHLYQTDGTAAGTKLVSSVSLDNTNGNSGGVDIAVSGNNLFYITDTGNGQQIEEASVGSGGAVTMSQFTNITPDNNLDRYSIDGLGAVGSNVYFWTADNTNASGDNTPITLWVSNGSASPTNVGSFSEIDELSGINGKAIFAANDGVDGREAWVSDGTALGTVPLQTSGGSDMVAPADFVADGTNLFFMADGGNLFYTDGTQAGTNQVTGPDDVEVNGIAAQNSSLHMSVLSGDVYYSNDGDLYKTPANGQSSTEVSSQVYDVYNLTPMGANIYFAGTDGTHGSELWKSDGTSGGTDMVEDINPGAGDSNPQNLTASGSELFFQAEPDGPNDQIFATNGTTVTQLTQTLSGGSDFENVISAGATSGVAFTTIDDPFFGTEPFKLTSTGVSLLSDVNTTSSDSSQSPQNVTKVGNTIYFVSGNSGGDDNMLWKTDGTTAGTVNITPTVTIGSGNTATTASVVSGVSINNLMGGSSDLYFESNADGTDDAIWIYNGTTAAPVQYIPNGGSTPVDLTAQDNMAVVGNTLYFDFDDGVHGDELWMTDGSVAGTKMVKDINTGNSGSSDPENLEIFGNKLLFTANDRQGAGRELWITDGTSAGTMAIKHLLPGTTSSIDFNGFQVVGNDAYFIIDNSGKQLWKTDGTAAGTTELGQFYSVNIENGSGASDIAPPVIGNDFFFEAQLNSNDNNGQALWKTDGTQAGTVLVKSTVGQSGGLDPSYIENLNSNTIVFEGNGPDGDELWKSDGTTAGTTEVTDINPGSPSSYPYDLVVVNGEAYFAATSGPNGTLREDYELYKSDGTAAGTTKVKQIATSYDGEYGNEYGADPEGLTIVGSKVFFTANDGIHGDELWESDGTAAGTFMVQDINPGTGSSPEDLNAITDPSGDATAVFFADNGTQGQQPFSVVVPSYSISVSTGTLSVAEGATNTFTVDLTSAPTSNVTVTIAKETGGSDNLNASATTLVFTPTDWDDPQTVTVTGGINDGAVNGTAVFDISAPNISTQNVSTTEIAASTSNVVLSGTTLNVTEGASNTFKVHLSSAPTTQETVTITFASGDNVLSSSPATLVFTPSNYNTDQTVTITSGTDTDTQDQTATFTVSASGFPDQTVTATQIDTSGPVVGTFTVTPSSGSSKSKIKLSATSVKGDGGVGNAANVIFYIDTNNDGVLDSGDTALKTIKPSKKGAASYTFNAKTLTVGTYTFFAQAVDSSGDTGQAKSGTFTLTTTTAKVKKAAVKSMTMIAADTDTSNLQSNSITQNLFSQSEILG
jgi:ELWxxDGT repeat protein